MNKLVQIQVSFMEEMGLEGIVPVTISKLAESVLRELKDDATAQSKYIAIRSGANLSIDYSALDDLDTDLVENAEKIEKFLEKALKTCLANNLVEFIPLTVELGGGEIVNIEVVTATPKLISIMFDGDSDPTHN